MLTSRLVKPYRLRRVARPNLLLELTGCAPSHSVARHVHEDAEISARTRKDVRGSVPRRSAGRAAKDVRLSFRSRQRQHVRWLIRAGYRSSPGRSRPADDRHPLWGATLRADGPTDESLRDRPARHRRRAAAIA